MAIFVADPMSLSNARILLTNTLVGLMALCRNIKVPIKTPNWFFEFFLLKKKIQNDMVSCNFEFGIYKTPNWMLKFIPKQVCYICGGNCFRVIDNKTQFI
jgi:hypothetical protein